MVFCTPCKVSVKAGKVLPLTCFKVVSSPASTWSTCLPMLSNGTLSSLSTISASCSCNLSKLPGAVGMVSGLAAGSKSTLAACGTKSSATYNCPVSRLPVRACARRPCAISPPIMRARSGAWPLALAIASSLS